MVTRSRETFQRELAQLLDQVLMLGSMVEVDDLYNQVYRELLTFIMSDPSCLQQANYLLWAAHNLERAADRVLNICERTVFMVTGEMAELN
jgi:phosphate uptake regulator